MSQPFVIFQSFTDPTVAQDVCELLAAKNIPFEIEDTSSPLDPLIIGNSSDADIRIKLQQQNFSRANAVLDAYYQLQVNAVGKDYYLFEFTDEDLYGILQKPDEWGRLDYALAQKILQERGQETSTGKIEMLKQQRIKELARPEPLDRSWIFLGYLMAVAFSPVGIFYGLAITGFKKTLPNGQRIYSYSRPDRNHGQNILIIACCITAVWVVYRMLLME